MESMSNQAAHSRGRRRALLVAMVLLAALLVGILVDGPVTPAEGAPAKGRETGKATKNPAAIQRDRMVQAIGQTNQKLDKIIRLLESGSIRVTVANAEVKKANDKTK